MRDWKYGLAIIQFLLRNISLLAPVFQHHNKNSVKTVGMELPTERQVQIPWTTNWADSWNWKQVWSKMGVKDSKAEAQNPNSCQNGFLGVWVYVYGGFRLRNGLLNCSGYQKFKTKLLAGPCSFWRCSGRICAEPYSWFPGASHSPWLQTVTLNSDLNSTQPCSYHPCVFLCVPNSYIIDTVT